MMNFEAIILAGGLGTRLRGTLQNTPKPMTPIMGIPFLQYQLDFVIAQGVRRVVLATHHLSAQIETYFGDTYKGCQLIYAKEPTLLGTGGAMGHALSYTQQEEVFVLNGDSIFDCSLSELYDFHLSKKSKFSIALCHAFDFDRYGTVHTDEKARIIGFREKKRVKEGFFSTGIYLVNKTHFLAQKMPEKFSLEQTLIPKLIGKGAIFGKMSKGYFIDIGIPCDFKKAQLELGVFSKISENWTLFLDRDGVINQKIDGDYVRNTHQFRLLPQVKEAIDILSDHFKKIIVVTNQQGVGKGLMRENDLKKIHKMMRKALPKITAVYHAPDIAHKENTKRKPHIGMALQAQKDFPSIDFSKAIMVGDSISDQQFAENIGATPVMIGKKNLEQHDAYPSLFHFAKRLNEATRLFQKGKKLNQKNF